MRQGPRAHLLLGLGDELHDGADVAVVHALQVPHARRPEVDKALDHFGGYRLGKLQGGEKGKELFRVRRLGGGGGEK